MIWLRGGRYAGNYVSYLNGTAANPIIVRQYPGERATLDGGSGLHALVTLGSYTWFWGFEVMSSSGHAIGIYKSVADRFINLVVHDASLSGIGSFTRHGPRQTEIYGCIVYNNGTNFNLDHGLYLQNDVSEGTFFVTDNIVFNNWAFGIHIYGQVETPDLARLSGFDVQGNVTFGNGSISVPVNRKNEIFVGGTIPASDIIVRNNYGYREVAPAFDPHGFSFSIGYPTWGSLNDVVVVQDNYIVGGLYLGQWASALVRGNLLYDYAGPMVQTEPSVSGHTWDTNQFYDDPTLSNWKHVPNDPTAFATWKAQTGFTNPGSYAGSGAPPDLVVVRPNKYEAGRANIIVYNWTLQGTVSVDISGVLQTGDRYVVKNAQDFYGTPLASGTYHGSALQLPMAGIPPPAPIGRSYTPAPVTGPTFNVFVLMKTRRGRCAADSLPRPARDRAARWPCDGASDPSSEPGEDDSRPR